MDTCRIASIKKTEQHASSTHNQVANDSCYYFVANWNIVSHSIVYLYCNQENILVKRAQALSLPCLG